MQADDGVVRIPCYAVLQHRRASRPDLDPGRAKPLATIFRGPLAFRGIVLFELPLTLRKALIYRIIFLRVRHEIASCNEKSTHQIRHLLFLLGIKLLLLLNPPEVWEWLPAHRHRG